jgi:hypothetical protein
MLGVLAPRRCLIDIAPRLLLMTDADAADNSGRPVLTYEMNSVRNVRGALNPTELDPRQTFIGRWFAGTTGR